MIRNLVLKLPKLKCTSEYAFSSFYRERTFRSLSPVQRLRTDASAANERSVSCSRAERGHSVVDISEKPQARTLCFSKEYYGKNQPYGTSKEIQWRENPSNPQEADQQNDDVSYTKPDTVQFETLEQYELEAARPRPVKSRDLIEAFSSRSKSDDRYVHLQPNQMKPYGSPDNLYSPMLIRPTNSLKYPKKFKQKVQKDTSEPEADIPPSSRGQRKYSTSTYTADDRRKLSTTRSCIAKEGHSTKDKCCSETERGQLEDITFSNSPKTGPYVRLPKQNTNAFESTWTEPGRRIDISPPRYPTMDESAQEPLRISTAAMRKHRKEEENRRGSIHYKLSYSDLVKLKLKEREIAKQELTSDVVLPANTDKVCVGCFIKQSLKSNKMLDAFNSLPGKRSLTTRSKSNIMLKDDKHSLLNEGTTRATCIPDSTKDQRHFSKMPRNDKKSSKSKKVDKSRGFNPECEDICAPVRRSLEAAKPRRVPFEPAKCENEPTVQKIYLPSKVKLPVAPCTPRPEYRDCKKIEPCSTERADECMEVIPKPLPKLVPNLCPCIDEPTPTISPKLHKLNLKFEDPPKVVCHEPPCQTPRADETNPYKHRPLRPYVPKDCSCIPPPPMLNVKLKRLPRCAPEEVCRPPRVCPIIDPCPPRADECYKLLPKKLPFIGGSDCPCVEPPLPTMAPPIRRLDLTVPEPERVCPKPPPCDCYGRADDCVKVKQKKLPKFVPGDCPCEDKPMVDWKLKRLTCEEELECIVPDPCKAFPRADWGCWEYTQDECQEVDEKCIEKKKECPKPVKKRDPCFKKSVCDPSFLNYRNGNKRQFSNSSSSSTLKLFQKMKTKSSADAFKASSNQTVSSKLTKKSKSRSALKKQASAPTLDLIKMINELDKMTKSGDDHLLFKPQKEEKIDYQNILKSISSTSAAFQKKEAKALAVAAQTLKKPKGNTLTVTSRAISTTEQLSKDETEIKKARCLEAKQKCKKIKPTLKSLMCKKTCPRQHVCDTALGSGGEVRPGCKVERVPVCCEKQESPYSSFSDNLGETINPYTNATPQWTCNRKRYGFHPVYKKEHEPFEPEKKNKKSYCTSALIVNLPMPSDLRLKESIITSKPTSIHGIASYGRPSTNGQTSRPLTMNATMSSICQSSSKGLLKKATSPNLSATQNRFLATKIFHIHPPETCNKPKTNDKCEYTQQKGVAPKITCETEETCKAEQRWCCTRNYSNPTTRKPPPFPAFSDCLDEEMEDILTECPLDREKYLRMQPRFMNPPEKPVLLKPPPPFQGKLDILKEQQCLREKLCIENKGLSQSCEDFGKPVPLMKTKKMIKEENHDCKRIEELKKIGRWPPFTLISNRRFSTLNKRFSTQAFSSKCFSSLGLNSFHDTNTEKNRSVKRIYTRNYHALIKGVDKTVLAESDDKFKEITKKIFPSTDETARLLKNKNSQGKIQNQKMCEQLNQQANIARKVNRFYSTYKIRRRFGLKRGTRQRPSNNSSRRFSSVSPILKYKVQCFRGKRYYKSGSRKSNSAAERCASKSNKKAFPKFTLNGCPTKPCRPKCNRHDVSKNRSKSFSPYPAYSKSKNNEVVAAIESLQPKYSLLSESRTVIKEFPSQEKIDRTLGFEYYKCKHGIPNEGKTIDCLSFGDYFNPKARKTHRLLPQGNCEESRENGVVEFLVQDHQNSGEQTTCCSHSPQTKHDHCDADRKKLEEICMTECLKSIPCDLPEEEKYCVCKERCKFIFDEKKPEQEVKEKECTPKPTKIDCEAQREHKLKHVECISAPKPKLTTVKLKPACKDVILKAPPCHVKKSKSVTQLETIWQKIVNYFKARPNCPQPGDYKKKALIDRAEKAANAAGLVVIDPKCLPPEILKSFKAPKKECKVCPNQDQGESKKSGTRSSSPEANRRNFCTNYQPSRNYSKSMSCKNLEEINKILEEGEISRKELRFSASLSDMKKDYCIFPERKDADTSNALKMSLDMKLHKTVNFSKLYNKNGKYPKTYFGYSDIIPSRENILERAWRISIEAYNKYNHPRTYNFFNEIFTRVEKSVKTVEDLEKLKTENVLRELDEFLKEEDPNATKKKK